MKSAARSSILLPVVVPGLRQRVLRFSELLRSHCPSEVLPQAQGSLGEGPEANTSELLTCAAAFDVRARRGSRLRFSLQKLASSRRQGKVVKHSMSRVSFCERGHDCFEPFPMVLRSSMRS